MEQLISAYDYMWQACGVWGITTLACLIVLFFIQLMYWVGLYGRIPSYRDSNRDPDSRPPVSVVVVFRKPDFDFIENTLPALFTQDYDRFEIMAIDLSGDADFSDAVKILSENNARFFVTKMVNNPRFPISNKMAWNVAIKSASYENIIITMSDSRPVSDQWLARMGMAFSGADVVIGYCGMESAPGFVNRMIRMDRVGVAVRWLSAAMRGKPYRGMIQNIGFTKKIYFENGGFNHLNFNIGEDDLFIQKLMNGAVTAAVVVSPNSLVRQTVWGGAGWWFSDRKLYSSTFRYYPAKVKRYIGIELWSRFLFFATVAASIVMLPLELKIFAGAMFVIRLSLVLFEIRRISLRLSEEGIVRVAAIYDLCSPFYEAMLAVSRRLKRAPGLWR